MLNTYFMLKNVNAVNQKEKKTQQEIEIHQKAEQNKQTLTKKTVPLRQKKKKEKKKEV